MTTKNMSGCPGDVPRATEPPDFDNLLAVLGRGRPKRATLFEFFMNERVYRKLSGSRAAWTGWRDEWLARVLAFRNAGYDYTTVLVPGFAFPAAEACQKASKSLNAAAVITDRRSFDAYPWPDPDAARYEALDELAEDLPAGMKLIPWSPDGVLENVIRIVGFDNLCFLAVDAPALVEDVFAAVGARLVRYYERCLAHRAVGAVIGNDDWGYKTQPMLSPGMLRRLVFPWHRRIVRAAHAAGRPAILHSCGQLASVMDDIIDDMKYDGKHSWEDAILPVEDAYARYGGRIAVLGGLDVDFVCRSTPDEIYRRARRLLAGPGRAGGYALGTGNSVPEYVPDANYFALVQAALDERRG